MQQAPEHHDKQEFHHARTSMVGGALGQVFPDRHLSFRTDPASFPYLFI